MPDACTVLIAAPNLLAALKERAGADAGDILAFTDTDALRALDTIIKRRPSLVTLERQFATTPRGAALINRLKADPALAHSEIRVVSYDVEHTRTSPQPPPAPSSAAADAVPALDVAGTRSTPRVATARSVEILVDGNAATLVDLSLAGAQVLSPTILRPNQRVRVTLIDDSGSWRFNGTVMWATFEIPPRYRAGIVFADPDSAALRAFCAKHQA